MKPTLLILAAGMGSRYGGLKQMDAFGPNGETILDYSIYDAIREGFGKVVFVIRESFNKEFREFFAGKFEHQIEADFVYQELTDVPEGADYNPERTKPWGTSHAVWAARHVIDEPFVVINADDFYGRDAYRVIVNFFNKNDSGNYALVGYQLDKTMSRHGAVNRGVCDLNAMGDLKEINERLKIVYDENDRIRYDTDEGPAYLDPATPVSMNFWGFYPDYFQYCEDYFVHFLHERGHELKSEFFIPLLIEDMIVRDQKKIKVLQCSEEWFGVTYREDKPFVENRIHELIRQNVYPAKLW